MTCLVFEGLGLTAPKLKRLPNDFDLKWPHFHCVVGHATFSGTEWGAL